MEQGKSSGRGKRVEPLAREVREYRPLQRLFLIDVLRDPGSRPFLLWTGTVLLIGVFIYRWLEGWSFVDALYFCVITLATIGYGDLTPTTPEAKLFTVFYVINGIVILLALFDRIRAVRAGENIRITSIDKGDEPPSSESD